MKILTGEAIREADLYTIQNEPVESINLMERAAESIAQWIAGHVDQAQPLLFFIGRGNNGGDGLAVARMLFHAGFDCSVVVPWTNEALSSDCAFNLQRLPGGVGRHAGVDTLDVDEQTVIVDALLGSGVSEEPLREPIASLVEYINAQDCRVISIDLPSGMLTEFGNADRLMVHATTTLTLEFPKLAQLLPEAGEWCGELEVIPIDLNPDYIEQAESDYYYLTADTARSLLCPREKFAHKGTYGHALLVAGSEGMMGAALLATGAALRSGCGLVTAHIPREERFAIQTVYPSALLSLDPGREFTALLRTQRYDAVGVGPGLGKGEMTVFAFSELLQQTQGSMVIDADALNILSVNEELMDYVPPYSVLTPHTGELRRLIGDWRDEQEKIEAVKAFAGEHSVIVVVKGAHTMICHPSGACFFNSSGSPALAKGGSGDVLTGLLTGLLARGYDPFDAAALGVYIHGLAGEKGAEFYGVESLMSSDLVDLLAEAIQELSAEEGD